MLVALTNLAQYLIIARGGGGGSAGGGDFGGGGYVGGYGGSSGGGGSAGGFVVFFIIIIVFVIYGYRKGWRPLGRAVAIKSKAAEAELQQAAALDPSWDAGALNERVQTVFMHYQADWSKGDIQAMKSYLSPANWEYNRLTLLALQQRQRQNNVASPQLVSSAPVKVTDAEGTDQDAVTYYVRAEANDQLIDTNSGQTLFVDNSPFEEFWTFVRHGNDWLLDRIDEASANPYEANQSIITLAAANNYYYSLDWGWLLLPQRGQLFRDGRFGISDINNHVIGVYHDVLIELYTYQANPNDQQLPYTVAQAALPKRYDSLIVDAKTKNFGILNRAPKGYNKLSLEWPDFNRRYDVYATNVEQVTAFELLHPVYMEKLFALDFKVSIEVVDNIVYLYSQDRNANYSTMLALLKDAFEEMKL